jgi:hypothetical protein
LQLRFQVSDPQIVSVSASQQVVVWHISVENVGQVPYYALPGAQVFVSHLLVDGQVQAGYWYASAEAARVAHVRLDARVLDIVAVAPGETVSFTLSAFTPPGEVYKIAWILDPYSGGQGEVVGGNTAVWVNQPDPENCWGNVGVGFSIPTPVGVAATPTASVTPYIPPMAGSIGG